ncbi:hypothetical protein [Hymenobacter ruricola]|uniref:DUF2726 domain-containing protein n=1 Tax=Hymenobacter ruricola TaxID=2791023 RepID=A0ABS0HZK6_9BACT|nr:hypothetical protein [Hymenobacter ruricola]MBF9220136.1 hypothetical protein [Hymenobacter ruricola]
MPTITEPANEQKPRLRFTFPDTWLAFKYDEQDPVNPHFYQERLEKIDGLRGVDIVAGPQPAFAELLLLEVKNYRGRAPKLHQKVKSGKLHRQLLLKAVHTWAGLHLGARQQDALLPADLRAAMLRPAQPVSFVVLLAEDPIWPTAKVTDTRQEEHNRRTKRQGFEKKLREKLTPLGIQCRLADVGDLPKRCAWQAEALAPAIGPASA